MSEIKSDPMKKQVCGYKTSVLAAYADGGLSHSRRRAVQSHVSRCDSCRAALADIDLAKKATAFLRDELSSAQPATDGFAAMMARIHKEQVSDTRKVSFSRFTRIPSWSAAVAAVLAIALMIPVLLTNLAGKSPARETSTYGATNDMAGAPASTSPGVHQEKNLKEAATASQDAVRFIGDANVRLGSAGILGEPIYAIKDGTAVIAIWFSTDADLAAARKVLLDAIKASFIPCENPSVIEIIEGETPIGSADSPENRRIQEALGFLPKVEASRPDDPGHWLILTWQVEN